MLGMHLGLTLTSTLMDLAGTTWFGTREGFILGTNLLADTLTVTRLALEERNLLDIQASILHLQKLELLRSTALFSKTEILEHSGDDHGRTTENCHGSHHPSGCYFGLRGETRRRF
jgi:hypothetical protein